MPERPDFLNQPAKLRKRDREEQKRLRDEAAARGVVPSKDSRKRDFIERSIAETEARLKRKNIEGREQLKARLAFLREERERLQ